MTEALGDGCGLFLNEQSLRAAILSVCTKFGRVKDLEILPAKFGPDLQCACFLRLDPAAAHIALRSTLNVVEIDAKLAFFADVDEGWTGPRM